MIVAFDRVAVVVINFRSHEMLERNLSVLDADVDGVTFVVVDSFSSMAERRSMQAICSRRSWRFVGLETNPGFGAAANAGAADAAEQGCRTIVFLNPDAYIDADSLRELATMIDVRPDRLVAPVVLRPDGSTWFAGAAHDRRTGLPGRTPTPADTIPWLTGACLAVSLDLWQRVGGFDPDYFMYWEDVDLSFRCSEMGAELAVADQVSVVHDVGGTQPGGKSPMYVRYCCRNRLLFAAKHLGRTEVLRWILWTPRSSWLIARRAARRRELVRSPALLWAMLAGTLDGAARAVGRLLAPGTTRSRSRQPGA